MDLTLFLPIFFAGLFLFFVVLFVVIATFRKAEQPGPTMAGPAVAGSPWSAGPSAGRWNGEILGDSVLTTLDSTFGVFEVGNGTMTFTPEDAPVPDWTAPCPTLVVAKRGFMAFDGADVSISWPTAPGAWRTASVNVSRERINRVMGNDFKDMRERGYADEFLACLAANGARVSG